MERTNANVEIVVTPIAPANANLNPFLEKTSTPPTTEIGPTRIPSKAGRPIGVKIWDHEKLIPREGSKEMEPMANEVIRSTIPDEISNIEILAAEL